MKDYKLSLPISINAGITSPFVIQDGQRNIVASGSSLPAINALCNLATDGAMVPALLEALEKVTANLEALVRTAATTPRPSEHAAPGCREVGRALIDIASSGGESARYARAAIANARGDRSGGGTRVPPLPLTFADLRDVNVERCEGPTFKHKLEDWTPLEWIGAAAGEVGEAANLCKKLRRGEPVPLEDIGRELADAVIYLDLTAARLGLDLGFEVARKFNEVSERRGSDIRL